MTTVAKHRLKEALGGVVYLLTIDASGLTGNPAHVRRFTNNYGEDGTGITYQGNLYSPHPYEIKTVKRAAKSNNSGAKISISDITETSFTRFVEEVGGSLEGSRVVELKVYSRFLDGGIEPNVQAYTKRLDHEINYIEDSQVRGAILINTVDPLSREVLVPSIQFSAGVPNSTEYNLSVFPAVNRNITEGR